MLGSFSPCLTGLRRCVFPASEGPRRSGEVVFEIKLDGFRALAHVTPGEVASMLRPQVQTLDPVLAPGRTGGVEALIADSIAQPRGPSQSSCLSASESSAFASRWERRAVA
jgi:hypothetical protein